jgi:hypothetical protein
MGASQSAQSHGVVRVSDIEEGLQEIGSTIGNLQRHATNPNELVAAQPLLAHTTETLKAQRESLSGVVQPSTISSDRVSLSSIEDVHARTAAETLRQQWQTLNRAPGTDAQALAVIERALAQLGDGFTLQRQLLAMHEEHLDRIENSTIKTEAHLTEASRHIRWYARRQRWLSWARCMIALIATTIVIQIVLW